MKHFDSLVVGFTVILSTLSLSVSALPVLPFSEEGGLERLYRSEHKADFFKLANHFRTQSDRITCGPTTGTIILNALRHNTEKAPVIEIPEPFLNQMPLQKNGSRFDPRIRAYHSENFINEAAKKIKSISRIYAEEHNGKRDPGLQLEQIKRVFEEAHHTKVTKLVVGTKETARNEKQPQELPANDYNNILSEIKKNLQEKDNYVLANYARSELKQAGGGHISPIAAYDDKSDSFLVLDVNPAAGPWVWVDAKDLMNAMNTFDEVENRGVLLISEK
jgi:hypothetical protein